MKQNAITYGEIDSTNAEAARLLRQGRPPGGTVIITDYQSGGRGQGENSWVSDPGKNILMSWIVYPAFLSVQDQFQLSKAVSLAITDFLSLHALPAKIKWPNDILCDGSKICGILIENSIMGDQLRHSIVGIGLNVFQASFPDFPWKATSMHLERERGHTTGRSKVPLKGEVTGDAPRTADSIGTLAGALAASLEKRYEQLSGGGGGAINSSYLELLYRVNEPSEFTDGVSRFTGVIRGVDATGHLLLERGKSIAGYGFHEIRMRY